jgi:predicted transcriptional regulator
MQVVDHFISTKAHRVAVLHEHKFIGVVSQSAIAALVVSKFGLRRPHGAVWAAGDKTLENSGIIEKNIVSVKGDATVMQALFEMYVNNISSVALLDKKKVTLLIILVDRNYFNDRYQGHFD